MAEAQDVNDALAKTWQMLDTTARGLAMATGDDPTLRPMGIHNVAVFGRSVTLVLQNLRTVVDEHVFDEWYAPHVETMKASPLCDYFKRLRNEILKEGPPAETLKLEIHSLQMNDLMKDPPPGATRFFLMDRIGGSGWAVEMPDGSVEKYYVSLPDGSATMKVFLDQPSMSDVSIFDLCREYFDLLHSIVSAAQDHFGPLS